MQSEYTLDHQSIAEFFIYDILRSALSELNVSVYELGAAFEVETRNGEPTVVAAPTPYVVYDARPQPDTWSKMALACSRFDVTVRAVMHTLYKRDTEAPVQAIDGALRSAVGEVEGVRVTCRRTATFNAPLYYLSGDNTPTRERGVRCDVRVWEG